MNQRPLSILILGTSPYIVYSANSRLLAQGIDAAPLVITNSYWSDAEIARVASYKNWNGVMVGYGVRNDLGWFGRVMQIIQYANPNIVLIDHQGPNDIEGAIERHFNIRLPLRWA